MNQINKINNSSFKVQNTSININYLKFSKNILCRKYYSFQYSYSSLCINNLIFNEKCRIVSRFKDFLIYDDDTEFLRLHFEKESLINTLFQVIDFYDKYNKVFPNYMILPENIYMYKNLRKKQKMIDENNRIKLEKEKNAKNNLENINSKENNLDFFDEKIKENINRQNNSMLTLSLTNTIISNYINYNDDKKNERKLENNSFMESNINNSSISISLYSKRSLFNKNDNNNCLYDNTLKSESSLENIINVLNNKKYKKININKNKTKHKKINIDIISNNNNNNYNNVLINNIKTDNFILKTPTKSKFYKKEKDYKRIFQINHKSLNNNRRIYNHKKNNTSDIHGFSSINRTVNNENLSKRKTSRFITNFGKEERKNKIIEDITSSILGKYKNNKRNKNKNKISDVKNIFNNTKRQENLIISKDDFERFHIKENKLIKVNNYLVIRKINRFTKNNDIAKYNKIKNNKAKKIDEEEKNNTNNSQNKKIYELFKEKFKTSINNKIKEKRKEIIKPILDTESTESTFNKKNITKMNFYATYDKVNNCKNIYQTNNNKYILNNDLLSNYTKEEYICKDYNTLNNFNKANNTENNNDTYSNNFNKISHKQKRAIIENKKLLHKKHKTFSSQIIKNNDLLYSYNKKIYNNDEKINYLNSKLKKIKEEILKNKNNFIEIKEKYRKLSENIPKKFLMYVSTQTSYATKKSEKMTNNNSIEKREKSKNENIINKYLNKEINNKVKIKANRDKNILFIHERIYSNMNNNFKNPLGRRFKKELTKQNFQKSKDKIIRNKTNDKKDNYMKKNKAN